MATSRYRKGVHELGDGLFAYLQPQGQWGLSNAGLIAAGGESLLVDTLFDLKLTREMLDAFQAASPAGKRIDTVVNTHANGDHCWGNQLLPHAEIIASRRGAQEMAELPPQRLAMLVAAARATQRLGAAGRLLMRGLGALGLRQLGHVAEAAPFVIEAFGRFDFSGITLRPPTRTFDAELVLEVGGRRVELIEVGPAHTAGDVLVHVPDQRTVFTGDILFAEAHPIAWAGPISNWIAACDRILALNVETVVPGHGPLSTAAQVADTKRYFEVLSEQARQRFQAGMDPSQAARDICLEEFSSWSEAERVEVNVRTLYREFAGDTRDPDAVALFASMAKRWAQA